MADSGWAQNSPPGGGRVAECLLRVLGGCEVEFRFAVGPRTPAAPGLGTAPVQMEGVAVSPVLVRKPHSSSDLQAGLELVIASPTLARLAESRGADSIPGLLSQVTSVGWKGCSFRVRKVVSETFAGGECLHRLELTE